MDNQNSHVINLANSIIGVSILAMPYCFKQCGVLLSVVCLLISSVISRLACHYLLKSAIIARRKTFEYLAFHIFGSLGKFSIEIGMIGFLLGTCVAFFVVMGDLAPAIISELTGARVGGTLRNSTLIALGLLCVLPLGLLKNVDSLSGISVATILFYCCLVLKIVIEALPHIFIGDWVSEVILWRPAGILQCLPIFSMALFCQTQLFEIYQAVPNASLDKMNGLIRVAVNICTWVYIFVGAFGYIAFYQKPFTGNILLSFKPSLMSDVIKMGFVLSLAFSFPLVIFPCRASLYSLLYKGPSYTTLHEGVSSNYIPENKFQLLTVVIVCVSLAIGILIPSIELVLGLIGSTIGVMICVIFPVTGFICISPKNTNERIVAQVMLFVGVIVMVMGTYANLYAFEEAKLSISSNQNMEKDIAVFPEFPKILVETKEFNKPMVMDIPTTLKNSFEQKISKENEDKKTVNREEFSVKNLPNSTKHSDKSFDMKDIDQGEKQGPVVEPVQPEENVDLMKSVNKEQLQDQIRKGIAEVKKVDIKNIIVKDSQNDQLVNSQDKIGQNLEKEDDLQQAQDNSIKEVNIKLNEQIVEKQEPEPQDNHEKIKKDDNNKILIDTIQKQNEVQREIVEQQKKLIEVIQRQQQETDDIDKVNAEKVKAVKEIKNMAMKAIESISGKDSKKVEMEKSNVSVQKSNPQVIKIENVAIKAIETISGNTNSKLKVADGKIENISSDKDTKIVDNVNQERNSSTKPLENLVPKSNIISDEKKQESLVAEDKKPKINENVKLIPLPIALAQINNASTEIKSKDKSENNEALAMRRDILAAKRAKRDTDTERIEKLNKAVKEVCNENKSTSTEKPLIKMLCKLSDTDIAQLDSEVLKKLETTKIKSADFETANG